MKTLNTQFLSLQSLQHFQNTLSVKDILLNIHRQTKFYFQSQNPLNYNLNAFLTIDKCRKVVQMKENAFIKDNIRQIQDYFNFFMNKNDSSKTMPKINLTELSKFTQLFYEKKSQLSYLESIMQNLTNSLHLDKKVTLKNQTILEKMKRIMKEIEEKFIIVINKCQQNATCPNLLKQSLKCSYQNTNNSNSQEIKLVENSGKQFDGINTKLIKKKIGNLSSSQQKIQTINQKIQTLKSQYRRLNCKTQWNKNYSQDKQIIKHKNSVINFKIEPNEKENKINVDETQKIQQSSDEQTKVSIKMTKQKTTNHSSSFTILNKQSKNSSFITNNIVSKQNSVHRPSNLPQEIRKYLKVKGQKKQQNVLKKKSTVYKLTQKSKINQTGKKIPNSVHRQSNFTEELKKGKSYEKRISAIKVRQSLQIEHQHKYKTYLKRASQTLPDFTEQKEDEKHKLNFLLIDQVNQHSQLNSKSTNKLESNSKIDVEEKELQYQEDQQQPDTILKKFKNKKDKNRRKGFSKKHIDVDSSSENQIQKPLPTKRRSSIWNEKQNQQSEPKKEQIDQKKQEMSKSKRKLKGLDGFRNRNKLIYIKNRAVCDQLGNDQIVTQKTIKTNITGKTKKFIRGHQNAIDATDCRQLYQEITQQWKQDKQELYSWCLEHMMRKKYDSTYKPLKDNFDLDFHQPKSNEGKMKILQSEITTVNNRKSNWGDQCENYEQIDFSKVMLRKLNQLGQKSMQKGKKVSNLVEEIETIYI